MPFATVKLRPGIQTEATPTLNEAGYSESNLIRWRDGLAEKIGGWARFYDFSIAGRARALHAWQDSSGTDRLAVGGTSSLGVIESGVFNDLTPQILQSDFEPDVETTAGSATVTIVDPNIANVTVFDTVEFVTPTAVGGLVLSGLYPIILVLGTTSYQIRAGSAALTSRVIGSISGITNASPAVVTTSAAHGFSNGDLVYIYGVLGMTQVNGGLYTVANATGTTFELSGVDSTAFGVYAPSGSVSAGAVPRFTTSSTSTLVTVTIQEHGLSAGDTINFAFATAVGGTSISGTYAVDSVTDVDNFVIRSDQEATSTASAFMNSGEVRLHYHITIGPAGSSTGYGVGTYGSGGYGTGIVLSQQTGTPVSPANWSLDNWGEILLANPKDGAIYWWQPRLGYQNMKLISEAPLRNAGIFVSMPAQILVAYGSTSYKDTGYEQDPLLVRWCDQENFFQWTAASTTQAGSYRIPTGSSIVGGVSARNYGLLWTDIDLWGMNYIRPPLVFGFNKISANCGLIAQHAHAQLAGNVYWMGRRNFFSLTGSGVAPMPCSVWDYVFQNISEANSSKCFAGSNTPFNEVFFFFPSQNAPSGEPDRFVKFNALEGVWDYGVMARTAWIDQSVLGNPISASTDGLIFTQESTYGADGVPIQSSFTTGYWSIADGQEISFVDYLIPDFKFGTISASSFPSISLTLYATDHPNGDVRTYGPYTIDRTTNAIYPRLRGRQMALKVETNDNNAFWRLGAVRFRYSISGRR